MLWSPAEATYAAKHGAVAVQYEHAILRSWRKRTTADTSAYGTDAPNYRRLHPVPASAATATLAPAVLPADLRERWQRVLGQMQQQLPARAFDTWLRDSVLLHLGGATAVVGVSNVFTKEQVERDYVRGLAAALTTQLRRPIVVAVVIDGSSTA